MKYAILFSSGEYTEEKTQISFLDEMGEEVQYNIIYEKTGKDAINKDFSPGVYNLFTHDAIFYDAQDPIVINNKEMVETYSFATNDGLDTVYNSGHIDNIGGY